MKLVNVEKRYMDKNRQHLEYWKFYRNQQGKRIIRIDQNFKKYFYVKSSEYMEKESLGKFILKQEKDCAKSLYGDDLTRITLKGCTYDEYKQILFEFPETFEADLSDKQLYLNDLQPEYQEKLSIGFMDIECDTEGGFATPENPFQPIIMISLYDESKDHMHVFVYQKGVMGKNQRNDNETIYYRHTEQKMLECFVEVFEKCEFDLLSGWNLENFDLQYLILRSEKLNLNISQMSPMNTVFCYETKKGRKVLIKGVIIFDLYSAYRKLKLKQLSSYKLKDVAIEEEVREKVEVEESIGYMWRNKLDDLIRYNKIDVEICKKINDKLGIIDYFNVLRQVSNVPFEQTLANSEIVLGYMHKKKGKDLIFPSKIYKDSEKFLGAFVATPVAGLHKNVVVLDLAQLYPSIIRSFNISLETKTQQWFRDVKIVKYLQETRGFIPKVLDELIQYRANYKNKMKEYEIGSKEYEYYNRMQESIKAVNNSVYGVIGFPFCCLYDKDVAESVTRYGRLIRQFCADVAKERGFKEVFGDSDSCGIKLPDEWDKDRCVKEAQEICKDVNSQFKEYFKKYGLVENYLKLEYQTYFSVLLITDAKKRYVGYIENKEGVDVERKLYCKGFELLRSDTPSFAKDFQIEMFRMILDGKHRDEILEYSERKAEELKSFPVLEVGVPKAINKNLDQYRVKTNVLKAAEYSNKYLGTSFKSGTKGILVYVKKVAPGFNRTEAVLIESDGEFPKGFEVDWSKFQEKWLLKKVKDIFVPLRWPYYRGQKVLTSFM